MIILSCVSSPGVGVLGGQLYAAGGHDGPLVRKSVEVYDSQTNTWRLVCDMNMCRRNAGQMTPREILISLIHSVVNSLRDCLRSAAVNLLIIDV